MTPRTIVHVPRRFVAHEWGGTETVVLEISKQQRAAGLNPRIITSMALADRAHDEISGIAVDRYPHLYPFFGLSAADRAAMDKKGGNLLSFSLLRALIRQPDVRIFHAHALKRLGGTVRTAARWRKLPYVVSLHGGIYDVPAAELNDLTKPIEGKFEWGRVFGALLGARKVLDDADHVICVGDSEAQKAKAALPHDRVSYLPNGVDCARFTTGDGQKFRQQQGIAPEAFLIVNISRIDSQKNQLGLLEAFARLLLTAPLDSFSSVRRRNRLMVTSCGPLSPRTSLPTRSPSFLASATRAAVWWMPIMRRMPSCCHRGMSRSGLWC